MQRFYNYPYSGIEEYASSPCVHENCKDQVNGYVCKCIPGNLKKKLQV